MRRRFLCLFVAVISCTSPQQGEVIAVADGDTFTMLVDNQQVKVRLYGIDAPERGQDYSNVSRQYLSQLVFRKVVSVEPVDTDRYGRIVGIVTIDNINVNEAMLKAGLAWHYKNYDRNPAWAAMENEARQKGTGLWGMKNPQAPWEYRKKFETMKYLSPIAFNINYAAGTHRSGINGLMINLTHLVHGLK